MVARRFDIVANVEGEGQIQDLDNKVVSLNNSVRQTSSTMKTQLTPAAKAVGSSFDNVGRKAGAAGIQVQQLVGQITGGQNAFNALSAQAADLGIVLGAPLVGVVVALGAALTGTLVAALSDTNNAMEELDNNLNTARDSFNLLTEAQQQTVIDASISSIEKLRQQYDKLGDAVLEQQLKVQASQRVRRSFFNDTEKEKEELEALQVQQAAVAAALGEASLKLSKLTANTKESTDATEELNEAVRKNRELFDLFNESQDLNIADPAVIAEQLDADAINQKRLEAEKNYIDQVAGLRSQDALSAQELLQQGVEANAAALEQGLLTQEEFNNAQLLLTQQFVAMEEAEKQRLIDQNNAIAASEESLARTREQTYKAGISAIMSFAKKGTVLAKAAFLAQKGIQAAEVLNNSRVAASLALAQLGPVAGPPAAAKMIAFGKINAGLILAQGIGKALGGGGSDGGGGGGGDFSSAGLNGEPTLTSQTQVNQIESTALNAIQNELATFDPDEVLPVSFTRRIIASIGSATAEGSA